MLYLVAIDQDLRSPGAKFVLSNLDREGQAEARKTLPQIQVATSTILRTNAGLVAVLMLVKRGNLTAELRDLRKALRDLSAQIANFRDPASLPVTVPETFGEDMGLFAEDTLELVRGVFPGTMTLNLQGPDRRGRVQKMLAEATDALNTGDHLKAARVLQRVLREIEE